MTSLHDEYDSSEKYGPKQELKITPFDPRWGLLAISHWKDYSERKQPTMVRFGTDLVPKEAFRLPEDSTWRAEYVDVLGAVLLQIVVIREHKPEEDDKPEDNSNHGGGDDNQVADGDDDATGKGIQQADEEGDSLSADEGDTGSDDEGEPGSEDEDDDESGDEGGGSAGDEELDDQSSDEDEESWSHDEDYLESSDDESYVEEHDEKVVYEVHVWVPEPARARFPAHQSKQAGGREEEGRGAATDDGTARTAEPPTHRIPDFEYLATFTVPSTNRAAHFDFYPFTLRVDEDRETGALSLFVVYETRDKEIHIRWLAGHLGGNPVQRQVCDLERTEQGNGNQKLMDLNQHPILLTNEQYVFRFTCALQVYSRLDSSYLLVFPDGTSQHFAAFYDLTSTKDSVLFQNGIIRFQDTELEQDIFRGTLKGELEGGPTYRKVVEEVRFKRARHIVICGDDLVVVFKPEVILVVKDFRAVFAHAQGLPEAERTEHVARHTVMLAYSLWVDHFESRVQFTSAGTRFMIGSEVIDTRDISLPAPGDTQAPPIPVAVIVESESIKDMTGMPDDAIHDMACLSDRLTQVCRQKT